MIDNSKLPKAYTEVLEILKFVSEEDYNKVPNYIISNMMAEKDSSYVFNLDNIDDFQNQELLEETIALLAVIFRDYWATDIQRKKINEIEMIERRIMEENKKVT